MKNQKNIVYLFHPIKGLRPFGAEHAANIMAIPEHARGGWSWPPEKKVDEKSPVDADSPTSSGTNQSKQRKDRDKPGD